MRKSDKITVLIVDDVPDTRENLRKLLFFERDITVIGEAGTGEDGVQRARELRPDVVLMDINLPGTDGISAAEMIRTQMATTQVIMMSVQGEAEYLRRAMLAGAREFLVKPFTSEELANSLRRVHALPCDVAAPASTVQTTGTVQHEPIEGARGKIFAVFSAKGGIGRTTVACNLAVSLRSLTAKNVAVVDGSLQFGDVGVLLNLQNSKTIVDIIPHLANLETELVQSVMSTHPTGVRALLAPPRPEMAELVTADAMKRILTRLREMYDYVIVDTWPSFQDTVLAALDIADQIILLFTLEIPAIKNVKLFLDVAEALGYPPEKIMLVLNRSDSTGGIRVADVEENLRRRIAVGLVSDGRLATYALNRGVPFAVSNPESELAKGILKLAGIISGVPVGNTSNVAERSGQANKTPSTLRSRLISIRSLGLRRPAHASPGPASSQ